MSHIRIAVTNVSSELTFNTDLLPISSGEVFLAFPEVDN